LKVLLKIVGIFILLVGTFNARYIYSKKIKEFQKQFPNTKVIECTKNYQFSYPEFPLYSEYKTKRFPNHGLHADISILEIPNAVVSIHPYGFVFVNDVFIKETQLKDIDPFQGYSALQGPEIDLSKITKINGRVALINHLYAYTYSLFILDILTTLALLELQGIEYDYIWIPYNKQFMKEAFDIWGLDTSKIIPLEHGQVLSADVIILPTSISQNPEIISNSNYYPDFLLKYVRNKMLEGVDKMNIQMDFPEKIFMSRKDAGASRKIPNEDEVFALFEPLGYQRFEFAKFSMAEKIAVANHAKSIVTFMGSGSVNILFALPDIKFYEIHQEWVEASYFFIAKTFGFHYAYLNASKPNDLGTGMPWSKGRELPLDLVKEFIKNHPEL
jgi:hypothetical protein